MRPRPMLWTGVVVATVAGLIRWVLGASLFAQQIYNEFPSLLTLWSLVASLTEVAIVVGAVFIGGSFVLASLQQTGPVEPSVASGADDAPTAPLPTEPDDGRPALGGHELQV
ncbi:hypothetical protein [Cellulomonas soli]|uniref:hypothetical protein n=1 Tax=Cellulomonas soli TaxID=931535 RepID=UPI003F83C5E7